MKKPEQLLASQVATHMKIHYPYIIYRYDLAADMPLPPVLAKRGKELHGKWNRKYPDLFIAKKVKKYGGLYLELKATDEVPNTAHTRGQAVYHQALRQAGYRVHFCCGLGDCIKKIRKYLKGLK